MAGFRVHPGPDRDRWLWSADPAAPSLLGARHLGERPGEERMRPHRRRTGGLLAGLATVALLGGCAPTAITLPGVPHVLLLRVGVDVPGGWKPGHRRRLGAHGRDGRGDHVGRHRVRGSCRGRDHERAGDRPQADRDGDRVGTGLATDGPARPRVRRVREDDRGETGRGGPGPGCRDAASARRPWSNRGPSTPGSRSSAPACSMRRDGRSRQPVPPTSRWSAQTFPRGSRAGAASLAPAVDGETGSRWLPARLSASGKLRMCGRQQSAGIGGVDTRAWLPRPGRRST